MSVHKTYKNYVGGAYARSESGRVKAVGSDNNLLPVSSRKDLRDAVEKNKNAYSSWSARTGYNKSQILYRLSEMGDFDTNIENIIVKNAGWADKYAQLLSSVNPVNGSFFNYSAPESIGVIVSLSEKGNMAGFVNRILMAILTGNTITCLVDLNDPDVITKLAFAEVINNSDVPAGVINIMSCDYNELLPVIVTHKEIKAIDSASVNIDNELLAQTTGTMKRLITCSKKQLTDSTPQLLQSFTETKTVWSPVSI